MNAPLISAIIAAGRRERRDHSIPSPMTAAITAT